MDNDYVVGKFVREEKNRFLCTVEIDGKEEECYIPSSCRLENFLELAGKEVLLKENQSKSSRTRLMVYALKFKRSYLTLRSSEANKIVVNALSGKRFSFLGLRKNIEMECMVDGYKADIYLPDSKVVIEIKSIITTGNEAVFPTVYSERALEQFDKIKGLLSSGYKVIYVYVSLNPYVQRVRLSNEKRLEEYRKRFYECVNLGMQYKGYTSRMKNGVTVLDKEINVLLD